MSGAYLGVLIEGVANARADVRCFVAPIRRVTMFTHVMIGSNDLERARAFYDATFAELGPGPAKWIPGAG